MQSMRIREIGGEPVCVIPGMVRAQIVDHNQEDGLPMMQIIILVCAEKTQQSPCISRCHMIFV